MKPVIYITPEGSANCIQDCPENPSWCNKNACIHSADSQNGPPCEECKKAFSEYEQALAAAKKNSIPFESQKEVMGKLFPSSVPFTDSIHPFPSDQYKVEVREMCAHDSCPVEAGCEHCKEPKQVAVLSPLKPQQNQI